MTEDVKNPKADPGAVRTQIAVVMQAHDLTQAQIAREAGLTSSVLSTFLADRYPGDNGAVADKLALWIATADRRRSMPDRFARLGMPFAHTAAAERILRTLSHAQDTGTMVAVVGPPGVGKTTAIHEYQRRASNVWIMMATADAAGQVPALEELVAALKLPPPVKGGAAALRREICAKLMGSAGLVIIDEAQHLKPPAIEAIRGIHDRCEVGFALCGNPMLLETMARLPQVNSRVTALEGAEQLTARDIDLVLRPYGTLDQSQRDYLAGMLAMPGAMRCVVNTVRAARALTEDEATAGIPGVVELSLAWNRLGLAGTRPSARGGRRA